MVEGETAPDLIVSVLVPTLRRPDQLSRCLQGLAAQTRCPDEIVVAHRLDDAATTELLNDPDHAGIRRAPTTVAGQVAALQAGAARCRGDVVAITDDDAVPRPDWLETLLAPYRHPGVGAVGGRDVVHHGNVIEEGDELDVGRLSPFGKMIGNHHVGAGTRRDVDHLKGANMSYRRSLLAFPSGLKGTGAQVHNDLATSLHVRTQGYRVVYEPAAVVDHYPGPRFDDDARGAPTALAEYNAVYNAMYSIASLRRDVRHRRLAWALVVGDTEGPGILRSVVGLKRRERHVAKRWTGATRANWDAWWEARRRPLVLMAPVPTGEIDEVSPSL